MKNIFYTLFVLIFIACSTESTSKKFGDQSKSEKYDFFINSTLNNYDLNLENDVKDQLNEFFLN